MLLADLDPVSYQQVRKAIGTEYDRLWRDDGGRDGKPDDIRTVTTAHGRRVRRSAHRHDPPRTRQLPAHNSSPLPTSNACRGENPTGVAEIVGGEALPQTVLERLMCTAAMSLGLCSTVRASPSGWGAPTDNATEAQIKAIIARDRHCRGKQAAPPDPNAAKYITSSPWEQGGRTDIDEDVSRLPAVSPQHPRPRLHRHQNQNRLPNHQPQQPTQRPLTTGRPTAHGTRLLVACGTNRSEPRLVQEPPRRSKSRVDQPVCSSKNYSNSKPNSSSGPHNPLRACAD